MNGVGPRGRCLERPPRNRCPPGPGCSSQGLGTVTRCRGGEFDPLRWEPRRERIRDPCSAMWLRGQRGRRVGNTSGVDSSRARGSRTLNQASYRGIPVTAWSLVSALGTNVETCAEAIRKGQAQFSPPPPGTPFDTVCGSVSREIAHLDGDLVEFDSWNNRFLKQALSPLEGAVEAARERWGAARVGFCVGSSTASLDEIENAYALFAAGETPQSRFDVLMHGSSHGMVRVMRRLTGFEGPASVVSNACASGGKTFASAKRWIEALHEDVLDQQACQRVAEFHILTAR